MFGLGLHLTIKSGREALVRLILTAVAVALGVGILLVVLADFHAYQVTSDRAILGRNSWHHGQSDIRFQCGTLELQH